MLLDEQFPSNVLPWRKWQALGVEIRYVRAPKHTHLDQRAEVWSRAVLQAIDESTALVAIEQAHWTDGSLFDLVAIGADALIAHCYKSILCHYGLGFAVLSERLLRGEPVEQSWLLRKNAEDFSRLVDYQDE